MIEDVEAGDAYDAGDTAAQRLDVLEQLVVELDVGDVDDPRRAEALRLVGRLELEPGADLLALAELRDRLESP